MTRTRDVATQGGLVLLNTTTFSAQSSVAIDNVFTSAYQNYVIYFNCLQNTANGSHTFKYRASGVDSSSAFYQGGTFNYYNSATVSSYRTNGATACDCGGGVVGYDDTQFRLDVIAPNLSTMRTRHNLQGLEVNATAIGGYVASGTINATTAFDGIKIISSAGTMTGTIRTYGVRN